MSVSYPDNALVDEVRAASRLMVRELGFMRATVAATAYGPSAVHAILEIGARGTMTGSQIAEVLGLEKSSVSRLVAKLVAAGEVVGIPAEGDARTKPLRLTAQGEATLAAIHAFAGRQVAAALARLDDSRRRTVAAGLTAYAQALREERLGAPAEGPVPRIVRGYRPGALGRIAEMHGRTYARTLGFGPLFEGRVAAGLAAFSGRLDHPANGLWLALDGERIIGSVAIDGEGLAATLGDGVAHLRWFIVEDGWRGHGIGRRLLAQAVAFCDADPAVREIRLWTVRGLDAARRLYEAAGFRLAEEYIGAQWGAEVLEQSFSRHREVG